MSKTRGRTSLVVQWLRLCISTAGGVGSVTGGGTKIANAAVQHSLKKKKKKQQRKLEQEHHLVFVTLMLVPSVHCFLF